MRPLTQADSERLGEFVLLCHKGRRRWPTVREASRALHWTFARVKGAVEKDETGRLWLCVATGRGKFREGEERIEHLERMPSDKARALRRLEE